MTRSIFAGFEALRANPLRTVLSTLGVIIGVAALVAILALGDGLEVFAREQIARTTDLQTIALVPSTTERVDGMSVRREQVVRFDPTDVNDLRARLDYDIAVARLLPASGRLFVPDSSREVASQVVLTDPEALAFGERSMASGRFIETGDSAVAVLSAQAAAVFGSTPDSVRINGRGFSVIGVLDGDPKERPLNVALPMTEELSGWLARQDQVPSLWLRVPDVERITAAVDTAQAWVGSRFPEGGVTVTSYREMAEQASQGLLVFKLALASIAFISLLVGGIGIMNILLASVSERTREIGIRKATGATNKDIKRQFLAESIAVAGVGCVIGVLVGMVGAVGISAGIRAVTEAPISAAFTWPSVVASAVIALLIGLIFGTYPARRASRLSPVDAIRHE